MLTPEQVLQGLTQPQQEAASWVDGPLLVLAGAGSGKTRTITRRIAYMVACGIPAPSILAITFTNKAAGEMRERVNHLLQGAGRMGWGVTVCTFHSLCARLLREFAPEAGIERSFSIFDSSDQSKAMKQATKDVNVSTDNFPPSQVLSAVSAAKNKLQTPEAYAQSAGGFYEKNVARIYARYEQILKENRAIDFDDLLLKTAILLRDNKAVREQLQDRYQYILIDEYQDTNHAQFILAHMLAMNHKNICATGDPDQSIYGWRGANLNNILEFEQMYPNAKVVKLEQNYRSTKTILQAASGLIAHNTKRKKKDLWTENETGPKIERLHCQDEHQEAAEIIRRLKQRHEEGLTWDKIAIFYRVNSLSRVLEDALMKEAIPYQIARGTEFYGRKEIKDVLAYLRVIANPADSVSLERIANIPPRGLGDTSLVRLTDYANERDLTLLEAFAHADQVPDLTTRAINAAQKLAALFQSWQQPPNPGRQTPNAEPPEERTADDPLYDPLFDPELVEPPQSSVPSTQSLSQSIRDLMERVVKESGLEDELRKKEGAKGGTEDAEGNDRLANVNELISVAAEYDLRSLQNPDDPSPGTLQDYLQQVTLVSDVDRLKDQGGAVTLMTLHAAKGLEFPFVAIAGMEDGLIPHARALDFAKPDDLEEERRLAFVGITRAMNRLVLSHARYRLIRGITERTIASQFFHEMPEECFEEIHLTAGAEPLGSLGYRDEAHYSRRADRQRHSFDAPTPAAAPPGFKKGILVRHAQFGLGRVEDIAPAGSDTKITVQFQGGAGRRTLLMQYAKLEKVET